MTDVFAWAEGIRGPARELEAKLTARLEKGPLLPEEALFFLAGCKELRDKEVAHTVADRVLLGLIDDADVTAAFDAIDKWYA